MTLENLIKSILYKRRINTVWCTS